MSKFIARAIVDDVLPPNFFSFVPERLLVGNSRVAAIRDSLDNLMQNQSSTRLMNIWGAGAKASVEVPSCHISMCVCVCVCVCLYVYMNVYGIYIYD